MQPVLLREGMIWHSRLVHASLDYLNKLQKSEEKLRELIFDDTIRGCEVYALSKMKKLKFNNIKKKIYILIILDDFSKYAKTYYH